MEDTILFWGTPQTVHSSEMFMALVVLSGGFRRGIILQGSQIKHRFYCGRPVIPEKKSRHNRIVCPCTQTEESYVHIYGQTVYLRDQTTQTPSLDNLPLIMTPPGTPLHGPVTSVINVGNINKHLGFCVVFLMSSY